MPTMRPHIIHLPQPMNANRVTGNGAGATIHEGETTWPEYAAYEAHFDPLITLDPGFVAVEWTSPTTATIRPATPDEIDAARAAANTSAPSGWHE